LNPIWYWLARWACRIFCVLTFRLRVYGTENVPQKGPFVLASNHQSFLDPIFCGTPLTRPLCFLARDTLFTNKLFGLLISSVNAIPVKRGRPDLSAIKNIIAKLKRGRGVCLFPEATRTSDGRISAFKGGFGLLCRRGNAPVVPVLIEGAFECWPRHQKLFSPGSKITVSYGKPISAEQITEMQDEEFADVLTNTLRAMQTQLRQNLGKQPYNYS